MNRSTKIFVLCYPHLGTLDNWMPVVESVNNMESHVKFTLVIPDVIMIRGFQKNNAVVRLSNNIFDTILIKSYGTKWIKHTSLFESIKWYQENRTMLRLFDILKRFVEKNTFPYIFNYPFSFLDKKIHKKEFNMEFRHINNSISNTDILFYDIHTEGNCMVMDILRSFNSGYKYSLPHALGALNKKGISVKQSIVKNKNNLKVYVYAEFQREFYHTRYGINENMIHPVGIPRHDKRWIELIQKESPRLPIDFKDNAVVVLSRHVGSYISFDQKVETLKNIKKIFIDRLGMKVIIKLHPNENQERIYSKKEDKIYENIFGSTNYGLTWVYSDLHIFALAQGKKLAISLYTGVVVDIIAMGIPCVEYVDLSVEFKNSKTYEKKLTQFVEHGIVEGVSNYQELRSFVDRWISNPSQISISSMNAYNKYFPEYDNSSNRIATDILYESKIIE